MHEVSQAQQKSKSESLLINLEAKLADSESSSKSLNATLSQVNMELDSLRVENSLLKSEIATAADMRKALAEQLEELGAAKKKATQLLQQVEIMRETISSLEQERMDVERRIKEQQVCYQLVFQFISS
jgi:chromosome segregation ATPase